MDLDEKLIESYAAAVSYLPESLRRKALAVSNGDKCRAEEIRLRIGRPAVLRFSSYEQVLDEDVSVKPEDVYRLVENVTGSSVHSHTEAIKNGFIPVKGGHRLGLCGIGVMKSGELAGLRTFSSANLRIAKEHKGAAAGLPEKVMRQDRVQSTLIVSPPGAGKTTLLRDLVRQLSDGDEKNGRRGVCVSVADERGEIAACQGGKPGFDLGARTDVMDGVPKDQAIGVLLRAMAPEVIAVDEITGEKDVRAIEGAMYCGVSLLATTHAFGPRDFLNRPVYALLRKTGVFENIVTIRVEEGFRTYTLTKMEAYGHD